MDARIPAAKVSLLPVMAAADNEPRASVGGGSRVWHPAPIRECAAVVIRTGDLWTRHRRRGECHHRLL